MSYARKIQRKQSKLEDKNLGRVKRYFDAWPDKYKAQKAGAMIRSRLEGDPVARYVLEHATTEGLFKRALDWMVGAPEDAWVVDMKARCADGADSG